MNYVERTWQGNRLPLKKAVCGIDLPHWTLSENDNEMYLSGDAVNKLAEYEELEEQGRLIKLPCKIGDKVYIIINRKIFEEKLVKTSIWYETEYYGFDESLVGRELFFSREDAESALANMKGE